MKKNLTLLNRELARSAKTTNEQQHKIFCIGRNKTGTTSLQKAFMDLGLTVGEQRRAEKLLPYYKEGSFAPILEYCKSAQVFQDFPFSYPETFKYLDGAYHEAKFILTVRDSSDQWYKSVTTFHAKMFGKNGQIPTKADLQNAQYVWKGWMWECNRLIYNTPEDNPYEKRAMVASYEKYNQSVVDYFKDKPGKLIVINLRNKESYKRLMDFLQIKSPFKEFPWENKTEEVGD